MLIVAQPETTLDILSGFITKYSFSTSIDSDSFVFELVRLIMSIDMGVEIPELECDEGLTSALWRTKNVVMLGKKIFLSVRSTGLDECEDIIIERAYKIGDTYRKTVIKLGMQTAQKDDMASFQYVGGPVVIVYDNPIRINNNNILGKSYAAVRGIENNELECFYRNKQEIIDRVDVHDIERSYFDRTYAMALKRDFYSIAKAYETVVENWKEDSFVNRNSHSYVGGILHVIPKLLPGNREKSRLALVEGELEKIKESGFETLMLGVVDPQSTDVHYGESVDGNLTAYVNDHGYWISGEEGVDKSLGSKQQYLDLVKKAKSIELSVMQDSVFCTMGYPAQFPRFSSSGISEPCKKLFVRNTEADVFDKNFFMQSGSIPNEDGLYDGVPTEEYADTILKNHTGSLFALPKLNLYDKDVLAFAISRNQWKVAEAGITSFRIDMAKHISFEQLKSIVMNLRAACVKEDSNASDSSAFRILLEYWALSYRDIMVAVHGLEDQNAGVYFYDFPLANAVYNMVDGDFSFLDSVTQLLNERKRYNVNLCQFIPTFIDHDFSFKPIYSGDDKSSSKVIIGYALACFLSANGPYVYFGFDKLSSGKEYVDENGIPSSSSDSRKPMSSAFSCGDEKSPTTAVSDVLHVFSTNPVIKSETSRFSVIEGNEDEVVLRRECDIDNKTHVVEAVFGRGDITGKYVGAKTVFLHIGNPSVVIKYWIENL